MRISGCTPQAGVVFIPEGLGKIDIVIVRIFKTEHFIPHRIDLFPAIPADILDSRQFVHAFTLSEKGLLKRNCSKILDSFTLPDMIGIKDLIRLRIVDDFLSQSQHVCNGFAGIPVKKAP